MNRLAAAGRASTAGSEVHRYDGLRDAQVWQSAGRTGMVGAGCAGARDEKTAPLRRGCFFTFRVQAPFPARA